MKITNVRYNLDSIRYHVEYRNRPMKYVSINIINMLCIGLIYIMSTNDKIYQIEELKINVKHKRILRKDNILIIIMYIGFILFNFSLILNYIWS